MKFELVKIFHLLLSRLFSFDDCFSCWVSLNQTFINGIEDGSLLTGDENPLLSDARDAQRIR